MGWVGLVGGGGGGREFWRGGDRKGEERELIRPG